MSDARDAAEAWARITVPYIAQRPVMRRSPDGGRSFPRSSSKGYRYEVAIQAVLPTRPTTVPTFDHVSGTGRLLVLDLDTSRVPAEGAADRMGYITVVVERVVEMIAECGGRALVDRSPSGGAHVYVLWASPIPFRDMRQLARACALRFAPVVDTSPMQHTDAQIRGPGSPHKSQGGRRTGFMTLTCSAEEAEAICAAPCGERVWSALQIELAAELDAVTAGRGGGALEARHPQAPDADPGVDLDNAGEPFRARLGGRTRRLNERLERTARTGRYDTARYPSRSEARQAVLTSAAARGWRLEHVRAALAGDWSAIAHWWRDDRLLQTEWSKAIAYIAIDQEGTGREPGIPVRCSNTSLPNPTPPHPRPQERSCKSGRSECAFTLSTHDLYDVRARGLLGEALRSAPWQFSAYQQIRTWQNAMRIVERLQELEWGARALTYRAILRAVGAAAQMSGSTTIEFGTRQLAYAAAVDHTTASRALQALREGPYALIDLVQEARGVRADLYQLVIPDAIAAEASRRAWRPGRIEAIHSAFRVLGRPAAFLYETLSTSSAPISELAVAALLPRSTAYDAIAILEEHGLAERAADGWRRTTADLDTVAARIGADKLAAEQLASHRADRADWHAYLGILSPIETDVGDANPSTAAREQETDRQKQDKYRRSDGRRRAPPWLIPPPRWHSITEADLSLPADIEAELAALAEDITRDHTIPDDVRAAIRTGQACLADDERVPAEETADTTELQPSTDSHHTGHDQHTSAGVSVALEHGNDHVTPDT